MALETYGTHLRSAIRPAWDASAAPRAALGASLERSWAPLGPPKATKNATWLARGDPNTGFLSIFVGNCGFLDFWTDFKSIFD